MIQAATTLQKERSDILKQGPADCIPDLHEDVFDSASATMPSSSKPAKPQEAECAAVINGGIDDVSPIQLWHAIMTKYKVAQACENELERLKDECEPAKKDDLRAQHAVALAEAVQGIAELTHAEYHSKLSKWASRDREGRATLKITHDKEFLSSRDASFWGACFVRLFPRGDCQENCRERKTRLPHGRWIKSLLTRQDAQLWRMDVEFVASVYNIFLRRDQMRAVEAHVRKVENCEGLYTKRMLRSCKN
jgi:hypothetical protein